MNVFRLLFYCWFSQYQPSSHKNEKEILWPKKNYRSLSLISTNMFHWSPANFFVWDMRRVVKRTDIDQDEKVSSALFAFEVQIFQLLRNFLTVKPIRLLYWVMWRFHENRKISQNGHPTAFSGLREDRPHYILKTRIIELQASFFLRQFFSGTLRKWRLIFYRDTFLSKEKYFSRNSFVF